MRAMVAQDNRKTYSSDTRVDRYSGTLELRAPLLLAKLSILPIMMWQYRRQGPTSVASELDGTTKMGNSLSTRCFTGNELELRQLPDGGLIEVEGRVVSDQQTPAFCSHKDSLNTLSCVSQGGKSLQRVQSDLP